MLREQLEEREARQASGGPEAVAWLSQLFSGSNYFSNFVLGGCPTKMVQARKRVPFFSRVTEQLSCCWEAFFIFLLVVV